MAASPLRLLFYALVFCVLFIGIVDILTNYENNSCEMTYMFEYPRYLEVDIPKDVAEKYPMYRLYYYTEGRTERMSKVKLTGIPVLFIPGNAGSHRQVRSLGSVALRRAQDTNSQFHFDYFSLSLNEELSGLFGGVLQAQTEFSHECIKHILRTYQSAANPVHSVVLVGHSMGGMIARALYTLPTFDPSSVHTIITQATPHQAPVINLDPLLNDFYYKVNDLWQKESNTSRRDATLKDITVFSCGGGFRDVLVRNGLTSLTGIVDYQRGLSSMTMSVPKAWVSTDHLCHVWCKQVVLATKRAMFDMVNKNNKQVAVNPLYRMKAFQHHFLHHSGPKQFHAADDETFLLDKNIKWETRRTKSWKLSREVLMDTRYSVVELPDNSLVEYAFVAVSNVDLVNWIGICSIKPELPPDQRVTQPPSQVNTHKDCTEVLNMSPYGHLIPPVECNRKAVHIGSDLLQQRSHIITILPASRQKTEVMAELYDISKRHISYNVSSLLAFIGSFPRSVLSEDIVINKTEPRAVFYNVSLEGLDIALQAYTAHLLTLHCLNTTTGSDASGSVLKLHVPWSHEHTYTFLRQGHSGNLSLKLQSGKPDSYPQAAQLHLYLLPACTYRLTVTVSWTELFGQFARFYGTYLPGFIVLQLMMVLSYQLKMLDEQREIPDFLTSHSNWAQPWRVVLVALVLRFMLAYPKEEALAERLGLMKDDSTCLQENWLWYPALPILLYLASASFINLYVCLLRVIFAAAGRLLTVCCARCLMSSGVLRLASVFEYILLLAALPVAVYVCGTLAILLVHFIYVLKVLTSYVLARSMTGASADRQLSKFHVSLTLLLLLLAQLVLNAPALLVWAQNIRYSVSVMVDPSRTTGVLVTVAALLLAYADFPSIASEMFSVSAALLYCSSVLMVLYCMTSIYRVPYFINIGLLVTAVPASLLTVFTGPQSPPPKEKIN